MLITCSFEILFRKIVWHWELFNGDEFLLEDGLHCMQLLVEVGLCCIQGVLEVCDPIVLFMTNIEH